MFHSQCPQREVTRNVRGSVRQSTVATGATCQSRPSHQTPDAACRTSRASSCRPKSCTLKSSDDESSSRQEGRYYCARTRTRLTQNTHCSSRHQDRSSSSQSRSAQASSQARTKTDCSSRQEAKQRRYIQRRQRKCRSRRPQEAQQDYRAKNTCPKQISCRCHHSCHTRCVSPESNPSIPGPFAEEQQQPPKTHEKHCPTSLGVSID